MRGYEPWELTGHETDIRQSHGCKYKYPFGANVLLVFYDWKLILVTVLQIHSWGVYSHFGSRHPCLCSLCAGCETEVWRNLCFIQKSMWIKHGVFLSTCLSNWYAKKNTRLWKNHGLFTLINDNIICFVFIFCFHF